MQTRAELRGHWSSYRCGSRSRALIPPMEIRLGQRTSVSAVSPGLNLIRNQENRIVPFSRGALVRLSLEFQRQIFEKKYSHGLFSDSTRTDYFLEPQNDDWHVIIGSIFGYKRQQIAWTIIFDICRNISRNFVFVHNAVYFEIINNAFNNTAPARHRISIDYIKTPVV